MTRWLDALDRKAGLRARAGLTRRLRPRGVSDEVTDLAGNDYLGLSRDPRVISAATSALRRYGAGATGSRLVRGSTELHAALEAALADWLGTESALVYSSGYLANLGAVRALTRPSTTLITDAHNHASLVDGVRLTGNAPQITPHNDLPGVRAALAAGPAVVITESVFSVDGDLAPLRELHTLVSAHDGLLLVDDAHALGVLGPSGAGGVAAAGLAGAPDVVVTATLSKALGAAGGVIAGPAALIRHLIDTGRTFIYDTALPPATAAAALAALELARADDAGRAELAERAGLAYARLTGAGLSAARPAAGVVSVTAPGAAEAVAWAAACLDAGVAVGCFRPPTTPDSRSRLRLTINVGVPRPDFERALDVIVKTAPEPVPAS
ncbi:aminotransferase class I/II-fold pyridoxal phosphate-dependent enzyme [Catenuloplanes indicus]|uniref:8-amino-7-oxononanoate synthase n=1 Tax=Catenuloplanes indicus TaxID=137267 RepID=A0AAE3W654_9ACTN|nr:aminotransferase class I/II-fold pyridoxal phosphate-dependent enzyme [Catenuloplanes indicus]MDQ0369344.1 8-amino-7-oxononanoate synthase [Catenuloplanes indicus]